MHAADLKRDPNHGVDSHRSWIVLGFICWAMLFSTLSMRAMGVVYVGILDHYGTTREAASWPGTLLVSAFGVAAPLLGYLSERWSYNTVLVGCTILTSSGIMLCYFAPSVAFIAFFYGVVHGPFAGGYAYQLTKYAALCSATGAWGTLSGIFIVTNALSAQYFEQWQTTACGLVWCFQCLGVFFMPDLANFILRTGGTPEMFLIMGALTLNALPTALFLGSPPWIARAVLSTTPVLKESASALDLSQMNTCTPAPDDAAPDTAGDMELMSRTPRPRNNSNKLSGSFLYLHKMSSGLEMEFKQPNANSELKAALASFLTLRFQLIGLSYGISAYSMITFFVIHVDLAYDRDVLTSQAIYLMHSYSIGDIVMRILIGVVIDRGYLTADGAMTLGHLGSAIACEALFCSGSTALLLLSSLLLGLSQGAITPLPYPLMTKHFRGKSLPIMMGGLFGYMGLLQITRPPVLGYFKDNMGRYDGLLHALAIISGLLAIIWLARTVLKQRFASTKHDNIDQNSSFHN